MLHAEKREGLGVDVTCVTSEVTPHIQAWVYRPQWVMITHAFEILLERYLRDVQSFGCQKTVKSKEVRLDKPLSVSIMYSEYVRV